MTQRTLLQLDYLQGLILNIKPLDFRTKLFTKNFETMSS